MCREAGFVPHLFEGFAQGTQLISLEELRRLADFAGLSLPAPWALRWYAECGEWLAGREPHALSRVLAAGAAGVCDAPWSPTATAGTPAKHRSEGRRDRLMNHFLVINELPVPPFRRILLKLARTGEIGKAEFKLLAESIGTHEGKRRRSFVELVARRRDVGAALADWLRRFGQDAEVRVGLALLTARLGAAEELQKRPEALVDQHARLRAEVGSSEAVPQEEAMLRVAHALRGATAAEIVGAAESREIAASPQEVARWRDDRARLQRRRDREHVVDAVLQQEFRGEVPEYIRRERILAAAADVNGTDVPERVLRLVRETRARHLVKHAPPLLHLTAQRKEFLEACALDAICSGASDTRVRRVIAARMRDLRLAAGQPLVTQPGEAEEPLD